MNGLRNKFIPPVIRLAITLVELGSGGYQWLSASAYAVSAAQSTLCTILKETTEHLEHKSCSKWISVNINIDAKMWFYRKYGVPGVIGCIDGTHIYFESPWKMRAFTCFSKQK